MDLFYLQNKLPNRKQDFFLKKSSVSSSILPSDRPPLVSSPCRYPPCPLKMIFLHVYFRSTPSANGKMISRRHAFDSEGVGTIPATSDAHLSLDRTENVPLSGASTDRGSFCNNNNGAADPLDEMRGSGHGSIKSTTCAPNSNNNVPTITGYSGGCKLNEEMNICPAEGRRSLAHIDHLTRKLKAGSQFERSWIGILHLNKLHDHYHRSSTFPTQRLFLLLILCIY